MEILQIVGFALVAGFALVVLRQLKPEYALPASVAVGVIIFLFLMGKILGIIDSLQSLAARASIDGLYMGTVLKIIGIAYLTEFCAQVLNDSGEKAIASKVELGGKVLILALAVPMVMAILEKVLNLLA